MKIAMRLFLLATVLSYACTEETADLKPEQIQFTFNISSVENNGGRVANAQIPQGSHLLLSLTDEAGNEVFTNKRIALLTFGEGIITEPVALTPRTYKIVDFMVVNEAGEVLFATPKKGSPLALYVSQPLPSLFTVSRNALTNVKMEVIGIRTRSPEAFGYASFAIDVVHPFRIAAFFLQNGQPILTEAKATISRANESYEYTLGAFVNTLSFRGDPNELYFLTVTKDAWGEPYSQEFRYSSIAASDEPLEILLPEAHFSMAAQSKYDGYGIAGEMSEAGTLSANWGFGSTETVNVDAGPFHFWRDIPEPGPIGLRLTGDVDKISVLETDDVVDDIYTGYLSGLKKISLSLASGVTIDLTNSHKLENVSVSNGSNTIKLPESHFINYIDLSYSSINGIDNVISNVYHNTVARNIRGGSFLLEYTDVIPGSESLTMLNELENTYGWNTSYIFRE